MEEIGAILARFPHREFEIRRCCLRDGRFRSICVDYEEASTALNRWLETGPAGTKMVEEYTSFLGELETEILAKLGRSPTSDALSPANATRA